MVKTRIFLRKALMPVALLVNNKRRRQPVKGISKYFMLGNGFINESTLMYGLTIKNYNNYLSDYQIIKTGAINQSSAYYLNNKVAFVDMLTGLIDLPKTLATISHGQLISRNEEFQDSEGLLTYLTTHPNVKLVIKPIDGAEGRGVSVVYWADGQIHRNSQNMTPPMFLDYLDNLDDYFISEFIQQGEFAQALFPETLNTIRMLTMIDPFTQKAFIAASVFRVGTSLSMPTDNFRRRGLSLSIAFDTGQLGKAAVIPHQGVINWYEKHPDTGMQLTGQSVPHWPEIKTKMLSVANHVYEMKQIKYVGWDVVVTNSGICLLEGNSEPGVSLHQVHQPILANPKAKAFYHYHKVL